ncbi:MAG: EamA family transporter [Alphaproteobacteria bacterium]|nr:EamA family transporter [Alphaproteobacteria bacterium]
MSHSVIGFAIAAAFLLGLGVALAPFALRHLSPVRAGSISVPCTMVLFWLLAPLLLDTSGADWRAVLLFATVGAFFPAMVTLLSFTSNRLMGPQASAAIGNLTPLFAVLVAVLALGEVPRPGQLAGILVIMSGVSAITLNRRAQSSAMARAVIGTEADGARTGSDGRLPTFGAGGWPLWALLLPLAGAMIRGGAQAVTKIGLVWWPSPYAATLANYTLSAIVLVSVASASRSLAPAAPRATPLAGASGAPSLWRILPWLAAMGASNGLSVLATYAALQHGTVVVVAPLVATFPLFTLVLAALLPGGFRLGPWAMLGVVATVAGVALLLTG